MVEFYRHDPSVLLVADLEKWYPLEDSNFHHLAATGTGSQKTFAKATAGVAQLRQTTNKLNN
jgi:hypothetical protein